MPPKLLGSSKTSLLSDVVTEPKFSLVVLEVPPKILGSSKAYLLSIVVPELKFSLVIPELPLVKPIRVFINDCSNSAKSSFVKSAIIYTLAFFFSINAFIDISDAFI